jgi:hypothetical protein
MSKKIKLIKFLTEYFNGDTTQVEVKLAEYKTKDSRIIKAESLTAGQQVTEITEEGEVPLEDGTYIIEEQKVEIIVKSGSIESVKDVEAENVDTEVEATSTEVETATEVTPEFKFVDSKTVDGKAVKITTKVEGQISIGDTVELDGSPAALGVYEMEDGSYIVCDASSIIQAVITKAGADIIMGAPAEEEQVPEEAAKVDSEFTKKMTELETKYKDLEQKFEKMSKKPAASELKNRIDFSEVSGEDKPRRGTISAAIGRK